MFACLFLYVCFGCRSSRFNSLWDIHPTIWNFTEWTCIYLFIDVSSIGEIAREGERERKKRMWNSWNRYCWKRNTHISPKNSEHVCFGVTDTDIYGTMLNLRMIFPRRSPKTWCTVSLNNGNRGRKMLCRQHQPRKKSSLSITEIQCIHLTNFASLASPNANSHSLTIIHIHTY